MAHKGEIKSEENTDKNLSNVSERALTPEYIYKTNQSVEDFNNTPFEPLPEQRNSLSPPSPFKPRKSSESHDEQDAYSDLGLFQEEVRSIFDPVKRSEVKKPVSTLYESNRDDTQLDVGEVIKTECKCKDGTVKMGWLDVRSGQKDCSPCRKTVFSSPNPYKNYKTKRSTPNFSGKSVPLRNQVGVSHFGDVKLQGCRTGNANETLEMRNKNSTLNGITNIDTEDSIGGSKITVQQNESGLPISLYDNLKTNVYGL